MTTDDHEFSYSTGRALTSFHLFSKLPGNLRALVLSHAVPTPRTRFIELYGFTSPSYNPRVRCVPRLPPLFVVSRETRNFSIVHENGTLVHLFAISKAQNMFYINFERDIIFLSSRFTPSGNSTETSRLRELSSLQNPIFLSQGRKIIVTQSSLDDFESVGGTLLDFVGSEKLYVAMYHCWSDKAVRTRLRQGRPVDGYVKFKIAAEMRVAESDETKDGRQ
ncbi:uncharacterized protein M421DRAFT_304429 [Didymella exigua CBS 183.55]|uniref:2EXR domain-containing protein n=1 Tax=Didymella exigua CBS 183.55 TaxID=1150837 RepID=A0A6A5R7V7_9PLEO|nr:uncharacterized protein M421DRAFT_304429 [Didymella exigua CBS 183.55]KAF1923723.1 hypothetical protein M421DRAFT_304429 [Didymella exigua CBS 183.55]